MVRYLEPQERMDRREHGAALGCDANACPPGQFLDDVFDVALPCRHDVGPGRVLRVDEEGRREIPVREHLRDVAQVTANLAGALLVCRIVRRHLDFASVRAKAEVMRRFLVREAHDGVAATGRLLVLVVCLDAR